MENKLILKPQAFDSYEIRNRKKKLYKQYEIRISSKYSSIHNFKAQIVYPPFPKHTNDIKRAQGWYATDFFGNFLKIVLVRIL